MTRQTAWRNILDNLFVAAVLTALLSVATGLIA
jgi:hypothetical protein